jgi:hypothetical protein
MPILLLTTTRVDVGPIIWICEKKDLVADSKDAKTKRNQCPDLVKSVKMISTRCWREMLLNAL